jgi:hypothetical protein
MTDIDTDVVAESADSNASENPRGRRDFLGKAAIAAAVSTVAGLSMSKAASAANGDTMIIGASNSGTLTTALSGGSTFQVTNGGTAGAGGRVASLYGTSSATNGVGVIGNAVGPDAIGVYGRSGGSQGNGVYGEHNNTSTSGTGVRGVSNFGIGVVGSGSTYDFQAAGTGKVLLTGNGVANPPAGSSLVGTIAKDSTGNLWACVASGTPGTWRKLAGVTTAGSLHLLETPTRVYDSRAGEAPAVTPKTALSNATRTIDCTENSSGVPTGATGVLLNVTAVSSTANGYLSVTPGGAGFTGTSTINWTAAGAIVANGVTVGTGTGATIDVTVGGGGTANFFVDVYGFYA